jgi:hypothetical protein
MTRPVSNRKTDPRRGQDVVNAGLGAAAGLQSTNKLFDFLVRAVPQIFGFVFRSVRHDDLLSVCPTFERTLCA